MMNLPKITSTIHTYTTLEGQKILFAQFTGGQEKVLLEAKESGDDDLIVQTVIEVLKSIVRKGDVEKLPTFEVENLLLRSRIVSVGSDVEVVIKDPETEEKINIHIDLSKAELTKSRPDKRVLLGQSEDGSGEVFLNLKYPTFSDLADYKKVSDDAKIRLCLDNIQVGDKYTDISEVPDKELTAWLLTLEKSTLKKLGEFIQNIPRLELPLTYHLKDGTEKTIILKDFKDFFM